MAQYVKIGDNINNDVLIEVPSENDGSLLLSSVAAQYPGTVGLRFKSETGAWRGCRVEGNIISAPVDGWGTRDYYAVKQAPKRAAEKSTEKSSEKPSKKQTCEGDADESFLAKYHIPDLMIADLPFTAREDEIREYFEHFGPLDSFKITYNDQGKSRGFGFMKFKTVSATKSCLNTAHFIHNRPVDIRYTKNSLQMLQMGYGLECMPNDNIPTKLFIGRLPVGTTSGELQETFSKYGALKDVYIPPNAKGYGFVTFGSVATAFRAMNDTHMVRGQYVNISTANQKQQTKQDGNNDNNDGNRLNTGTNLPPMGGFNNHGNHPRQQNVNNMASFLLENMNRMSQMHSMQAKMEQAAVNKTSNTPGGFQGAYGGVPGVQVPGGQYNSFTGNSVWGSN